MSSHEDQARSPGDSAESASVASSAAATDESMQKAREAAERAHQRKIAAARSRTRSMGHGELSERSEREMSTDALRGEGWGEAGKSEAAPESAEGKAGKSEAVSESAEHKTEENRLENERKVEEERMQVECNSKADQERERKIEQAKKEAEQAAVRNAEEERLETERYELVERKAAAAKADAERLEAERVAEEHRIERERIAEEERMERERVAEEERMERQRVAEEERMERQRVAEEERMERERVAEVERIEKERIARAEEKARRMSACGARFIKSRPPDLKIIIKAGENDVDKDDYELWYNSDVMTEYSEYIENAVLDFQEREVPTPWEVRMDDLTFEDWELMMRFMDPLQSRYMTAQHVLQVSEYYDQYEFSLGRQLCDTVLAEYFLKQDDLGLDAHLVVDAVVVAYKAHLHKAYKIGNPLLKRALDGLQKKLMKSEQTLAEVKAKYNRERDLASRVVENNKPVSVDNSKPVSVDTSKPVAVESSKPVALENCTNKHKKFGVKYFMKK